MKTLNSGNIRIVQQITQHRFIIGESGKEKRRKLAVVMKLKPSESRLKAKERVSVWFHLMKAQDE